MHINYHLAEVCLELYWYLYQIVALYISKLNQECWYLFRPPFPEANLRGCLSKSIERLPFATAFW